MKVDPMIMHGVIFMGKVTGTDPANMSADERRWLTVHECFGGKGYKISRNCLLIMDKVIFWTNIKWSTHAHNQIEALFKVAEFFFEEVEIYFGTVDYSRNNDVILTSYSNTRIATQNNI